MLHQPLELGIPSMAAARSRRSMGPLAEPVSLTSAQNKSGADETAQLIEAIDEAFATLPYSAPEKPQAKDAAMHQSTDLRHQTDSLAGLLAVQLKELDQQRGRLAHLLDQIAQPLPAEK